jgi:hypothetical protein
MHSHITTIGVICGQFQAPATINTDCTSLYLLVCIKKILHILFRLQMRNSYMGNKIRKAKLTISKKINNRKISNNKAGNEFFKDIKTYKHLRHPISFLVSVITYFLWVAFY